ncbi:MAG TPA: CapA family protein [Trichocoleus sp.]
MVSAVNRAPVSGAQVDSSSASVRSQAAAGHFRAIALWLNEPLAPQGIYVQVQADPQPGCLRLLLEFEQTPLQEKLVRFLCHRIWLLNSPLIEGIHVVARPVNRPRIAWQQRVRIITPALKEHKQKVVAAVAPSGSPLPPRLKAVSSTATPKQTPELVGSHLKTFRALVLTGSAVAAFVFGCLMEVILAGPSPTLPTFANSRPESPQKDKAEVEPAVHWGVKPSESSKATPVGYQPQTAASELVRSPIVDAALEPVAVIQHTPPDLSPQSGVTLLFGGDVSLGEVLYDDSGQAKPLFASLKDYQQADLSLVNLDTPLTAAATSLKEELYQRSRPEAVKVLKEGGVDIVNLTSEKNMEFGGEGLSETLETLDREGLYRLGAGRNGQEARRPEIIDVKGKRIAYLSYAQGGDEAAHGERPGINAQGLLQISEDIRALRDQVDWIVVNYRWQADIPTVPADWQKNIARMAIEQGADLVVGYHPDTLQGAEIYKGRPIAYSLGDFVFKDTTNQPLGTPIKDQDTAILKVSLRENQMKVEFVPVRVRNAQPEMATGREEKTILDQIKKSSAQFDKPMQSPVVLKLKGKTQENQPRQVNPNTPFVAPEAPSSQPIEPLIDESFKEQKRQVQPENLLPAEELESPELPASAEELESLDLPASTDEGLQDWGPKTDSEQQFTPIPEAGPQRASDEWQGDGPSYPSYPSESYPSESYPSESYSPSESYPSENVPSDNGFSDDALLEAAPSEYQPFNYGEGTSSEGTSSGDDSSLDAAPSEYQPFNYGPSEGTPSQDGGSSDAAPSEYRPSTYESFPYTPSGYRSSDYEPSSDGVYETDLRQTPEPRSDGWDPEAIPASEDVPTIDGPALTPDTLPQPEAIRPYNEPLVGPLGSNEVGGETLEVAVENPSLTNTQPSDNPETANPETSSPDP